MIIHRSLESLFLSRKKLCMMPARRYMLQDKILNSLNTTSLSTSIFMSGCNHLNRLSKSKNANRFLRLRNTWGESWTPMRSVSRIQTWLSGLALCKSSIYVTEVKGRRVSIGMVAVGTQCNFGGLLIKHLKLRGKVDSSRWKSRLSYQVIIPSPSMLHLRQLVIPKAERVQQRTQNVCNM